MHSGQELAIFQQTVIVAHRESWCRRKPSFAMAYGMDGAIDGPLVDAPAVSYLPCLGGFLTPFLVLLPGEQLIEQKAIFLRKLLDPI
jgi:hypothetical protein